MPSPTQSESSGQGLPLNLSPISLENLLNPIPLYMALQEREPVHWSAEVHAWFLTRYADVVACLRDPRLSADRTNFFQQQLQGKAGEAAKGFFNWVRVQMTMRDGPDHIRARRHVSPGFSPSILDAYLPSIRHHMRQLLDQVQERGSMDVVSEISYHLPPLVIAEFLGIPGQDQDRFRAWAKPLADMANPSADMDPEAVAQAASTAIAEMTAYLNAIVDERRHNPGLEMISMLTKAQQAGQLSPEEMTANTILVLTAGHLTTTDQLNNGIYELLTRPNEVKKLREDPTQLRGAIEEMMRFSPAVPFIFRVAASDFTLHGKNIRKGDTMFLGIGAANRDPSVFPDPNRFDISRDHTKQKHLLFGFGAHHCLGAGLARRELEIAIEMLLERFPHLSLDETRTPQPKLGLVSRGYNGMYLKW